MSIRIKTLSVVLALLTLSYAVLGLLLVGRIRSDFARLEQREAVRNMERVREATLASVDALCEKLSDWAVWDDSYAFMANRNAAYIESNIVEASFTGMRLNLMLFIGADGKLTLGQAFDEAAGMGAVLPAKILETRFAPGSPLLAFAALDDTKRGVLVGEGHPPLLFCARAVLTSAGAGPARGAMVFGAWLTSPRQESLRKLTRLALDFSTSPPEPPPAGDGFQIAPRSKELLVGRAAFRDPDGRGALLVQASLPREIHREAQRTTGAVLLALAFVGVVLVVATILLLEALVLRRLAAMSAEVKRITDRFEFARRVSDSGSDEISRLGRSVNGLLSAMEQATMAGGADGGRHP